MNTVITVWVSCRRHQHFYYFHAYRSTIMRCTNLHSHTYSYVVLMYEIIIIIYQKVTIASSFTHRECINYEYLLVEIVIEKKTMYHYSFFN